MIENAETTSVINFLKENIDVLENYFKKLYKENNLCTLSYSGLLIDCKLSGTTKEGVDFQSSKVQRSIVSSYIKATYVEKEQGGFFNEQG